MPSDNILSLSIKYVVNMNFSIFLFSFLEETYRMRFSDSSMEYWIVNKVAIRVT
jgi:hypothetical protein